MLLTYRMHWRIFFQLATIENECSFGEYSDYSVLTYFLPFFLLLLLASLLAADVRTRTYE